MKTPQTEQQPAVAFYTLGCKLNFAETSAIARTFEAQGYRRVEWEDDAQVYVINTCTVTDNADRRVRSLVRGVLRRRKDAFVVAAGCYAQVNPEEIRRSVGVSLVVGAADKFRIPELLPADLRRTPTQVVRTDLTESVPYHGAYSLSERTRAFLKIQDGCDYRCSYCTSPRARGGSRSEPLESVLESARTIVASGIREIVLTGVNTGDWGRTQGTGETFFDLVQALEGVEGLDRIRISSIEPNLLTDPILEFIARSRRFVPHFHIPLQSGCDQVLREMRRRYLTPLYRHRVERIRELMPHACIGADVIVGFPTETDEYFRQSYDFIESLDLSYLHVFTYSERENTPAAEMGMSVPPAVRAARSRALHRLGEKKRAAFYLRHQGQVREVLLESENKEGWMFGFTDNYIKVRLPYDPHLVGTLQAVRLGPQVEDGLLDASLL